MDTLDSTSTPCPTLTQTMLDDAMDYWNDDANTPHLTHLRFDDPLVVDIDGRNSLGVIRKPGSDPPCDC